MNIKVVLPKSRGFESFLLGLVIHNKLWFHHLHHQLEENQYTNNLVDRHFISVFKQLLSRIERIVSGTLDMILGNEMEIPRRASKTDLVGVD